MPRTFPLHVDAPPMLFLNQCRFSTSAAFHPMRVINEGGQVEELQLVSGQVAPEEGEVHDVFCGHIFQVKACAEGIQLFGVNKLVVSVRPL
ncbi:hypothetical protein POVWA2_007250 [Plasmodium ovale wallikeri]|uniref:Uncharacterized protein n=1 Tax=Plasmodium ovale wallikeri TaxID=864142 RepID=A0A1A8YIP7_PLAOA|nr:hypothetical protein POVWA1_007040 [Plasmodium ovale wallikeri]SBT32016.1 hypothetical protein POVWA2_007250 [Plasmodium ovale wallikeri]